MTSTTTIDYNVATDDYPLNVYQGESWNMDIVYADDTGAVVDITGYTAEMTIRESPGGPALIDLTSGAGITIVGVTGSIGVAMTSTQTAGLEIGSAYYDLAIKTLSGLIKPLLRGPVNVTARMARLT